ncbi:MAG: hypothetical protein ACOYOA_08240 [Saprospiraceae bacterium]
MRYFFIVAGSVLLGLSFFVLIGWTTMTLWNILIPTIFGLSSISFWQAIGLLLLSRILFGGFWNGAWKSRHWQQKKDHWKQKMQDRWSTMSEDEKIEWKNRLEKHCGFSQKTSDAFSSVPEKENLNS